MCGVLMSGCKLTYELGLASMLHNILIWYFTNKGVSLNYRIELEDRPNAVEKESALM